MYQVKIKEKDAGQRLDKYLHRILPRAGAGFLYKMLRKKNITLNDKKADGSEKIAEGDSVTIYFSDETLAKFSGNRIPGKLKYEKTKTADNLEKKNMKQDETIIDCLAAYKKLQGVRILYENVHVLLVDKPPGILSQKADKTDFSLNEWLIGYLLHSNAVTEEELTVFKPSVCNRLDRNTSGIVLCSKTLKGAQLLGDLLKNRTLHKYYRLYVKGIVTEEQLIEGYLLKDEALNKVYIEPVNTIETQDSENMSKIELAKMRKEVKSLEEIRSSYIKTGYKPVQIERDKTLLEVELFTGKTHQIRAHLASIGHPLLGDPKYGDAEWNEKYRRKYHIRAQLLHAYKVIFPQLTQPFEDLSGKTFCAELPDIFHKVSDPA